MAVRAFPVIRGIRQGRQRPACGAVRGPESTVAYDDRWLPFVSPKTPPRDIEVLVLATEQLQGEVFGCKVSPLA